MIRVLFTKKKEEEFKRNGRKEGAKERVREGAAKTGHIMISSLFAEGNTHIKQEGESIRNRKRKRERER